MVVKVVGDGMPGVRAAKEVFLLMRASCRVSRNIRALWFFDHLNRSVSITCDPADNDEGKELEVVGLVAKDGEPVTSGEHLRICSDTLITYLSKFYRLVFVLDLSPSVFVADGASECVLHSRLIESLRTSLLCLTKSFVFPGTTVEFYPQLYVTVCVYTPFICFADDFVILQGILLKAENVEETIDFVRSKLAAFTNRLCECMQPHLRKWNRERRRARQEADDLLPGNFFLQQSQCPDDSQIGDVSCTSSVVNDADNSRLSGAENSDDGFIQPEWSLIFMLRMGLLGVQMLPENTQSNIILITDTVCGMPDIHALQQVLTQLRSFTVSCSFIQLQAKNTAEPVFGHVPYPELFQFLAMATFGAYLPHCRCTVQDEPSSEMNLCHRALLCWSFQRALADSEHIKSLVKEINPDFAEFYISDIVRSRHLCVEYETNLRKLLYVRMREGFTIKEIRFVDKGKEKSETFIVVELRLPWKPLVFIDYKITAAWPPDRMREKVKVSLIIEAPYCVMKDIAAERNFASAHRQSVVDAFRRSVGSILQADRLLMHLHSFNANSDYFCVPSEVNCENALFRFIPNGSKPAVALISRDLEALCVQNTVTSRFVDFWKLLCDLDEGIWQKWFHTHTLRLILVHDEPLPSNIFTPSAKGTRLGVITSQDALTALHNTLSQISTFPLVRGQSYVKLVRGEGEARIPEYFFMIRASMDAPCIALKIAFLGGVSGVVRNKVVEDLVSRLSSLTVDRRTIFTVMCEFADSCDESNIFQLTTKASAVVDLHHPVERILVRYQKIPLALDRIVRLERGEKSNREMILHNSIAKYLSCSRRIWYLQNAFPASFSVSYTSAEYILHTILQRRLNEGFHIAYGLNGIVNLIRQVESSSGEHCESSLTQYIMFPPSPIRELRIHSQPSTLSQQELSGRPFAEGFEDGGNESASPRNGASDLQLVTELWTEPLATIDPTLVSDTLAQYHKIHEVDESIIRALCTFDELMSVCVHQPSATQLTLPKSSLEWARASTQSISNTVFLVRECFSLSALLRCVTEREVLLLPTLTFQDADPASMVRLRIMLDCLHKELLAGSNVCIEVNDAKLWTEITEDMDPSTFGGATGSPSPVPASPSASAASSSVYGTLPLPESAFAPVRVYLSRLSPWRLIVAVLPTNPEHVLSVTSRLSPSIPLLVFHCDEPWIAHSLAQTAKPNCETIVKDLRGKNGTSTLAELNRQLHDLQLKKTQGMVRHLELHWLSTSRICESEARVHTIFNLSSHCELIADQFFTRAFVAAVYRSLVEDVYVPCDDFVEAAEDRCEQANIEIDGIDDCIKLLCAHVVDNRTRLGSFGAEISPNVLNESPLTTSSEKMRMDVKSCEEEQEDFQLAFKELISRHFRAVPNFPNYFYYAKNQGLSLPFSQLMKVESGENNCHSGPAVIQLRSATADDVDERRLTTPTVFSSPCLRDEVADINDESSTTTCTCSESAGSTCATRISESELVDPEGGELAPLFLNFSCAVRFPNQEMHTFPIDHLPACMLGLVEQCPNVPPNIETVLEQVEVTLDMYVLSWPTAVSEGVDTVSVPSLCSVSSSLLMPRRSTMDSFNFEAVSVASAPNVITELPPIQNSAVKELQEGISQLLEMETILILSRYEDSRPQSIEKVINFIAKEAENNDDEDRIKMGTSQIVLVMDQTKALRRLKERMRGLKLDYCELSAVKHSHNTFFCCGVTDMKRFEATFPRPARRASCNSRKASNAARSGSFTEGCTTVRRRVSRQPTQMSTDALLERNAPLLNSKTSGSGLERERNASVPLQVGTTCRHDRRDSRHRTSNVFDHHDDDVVVLETASRVRKQELNDLWLILTVEAHEARIYFCQRYAHLHERLFHMLCRAVQKECRLVNQELLLEKMHATKECDNLLIANDTIHRKYGCVSSPLLQVLPDSRLARSLVYSRSVTPRRRKTSTCSTSDDEDYESVTSEYARVAYESGHFACDIVAHHWFWVHPRLQQLHAPKQHPFTAGYESLRQGIQHFAVRNRRNLYVVAETNRKSVFYMRLHMTEESVRENSVETNKNWMDEIDVKLRNHILLTVHGVCEPGTDLKTIIDSMQRRIDTRVLEEITVTLVKNPLARLTSSDVNFIQRDPLHPDAIFYCTLPSFTEDFLGSVYFYLQQQMLTFSIAARFREHSGSDLRFSERTHFCPYAPLNSTTLPDSFAPPFFIVNRPISKGNSNLGIGCVEIRVVDVLGVYKARLPCAKLTPNVHSQLYPGGGARQGLKKRFDELTRTINTSLPLPDSLAHARSGEISSLVQFTVWQVGDVGLCSLHARFRLAVQQALCDLVTEFGLLSVSVLDTPQPFSPVDVRAPPASLCRLRHPRHPTELRKRSSSDALITAGASGSPVGGRFEVTPAPPTEPVAHIIPPTTSSAFPFDDNKRGSISFPSPSINADGTFSLLDEAHSPPAYVNCQFASVASEWFEHVVSEVKNNTEQQFSVKKHLFHLDSDHSPPNIFKVVSEQLRAILPNETVTICEVEAKGSRRFSSVNVNEFLSKPFVSDEGRKVDSENEQISLVLLAYNHEHMAETLKYGADYETSLVVPDALEDIIRNNDNSYRFLPQIAPFVPRQHLLFFLICGETSALYLYNYSAEAAERVYKIASSTVWWYNARSRLLREIGLHKMGVSHLSARLSPISEALVWLNAEVLSKYTFPEEGTPDFDGRFVGGLLSAETARLRMKLYRHANNAFLAMNLLPTYFEDQSEQMLMLEDEVNMLMSDHEQFSALHRSLLSGSSEAEERVVQQITLRSRDVHFVKSPLLLFPRWRQRIGEIRTTAEGTTSYCSYRHSLADDPCARRASGSRLSRFEVRSNTFSTALEGISPLALTHLRREDDDPCSVKIQFMLVESYVEYAKKLGLSVLEVKEISPDNMKKNMYTLKYDTQTTHYPPHIWLYKAAEGGIIFVNVTFVEPYFSVRFLLWNETQLSNVAPVEDLMTAKIERQRELEAMKDELVARSHAHSFTYDFHLRMVATYLVGGQQVLFNQGYNTFAFLMDFLQYYGCRPPYARNCIYEEKAEFGGLPVESSLIWEHFLAQNNDEWRVVRMKPLDSGAPDQFMLVSEDSKECLGLGYQAVRVVLHDPQAKSAPNCLNIRFYIMLVSHQRTDPFVENLYVGPNHQASLELGEFKEMKNAKEEFEVDTEDGSTNSQFDTDTSESATPCNRRRFCSGDHIPILRTTELAYKFSSDAETVMPRRSLDLYTPFGEGTSRLSIQKNAPRRHRKQYSKWQAQKLAAERGTVVPREQVTYVHYFSERQRKLQGELEDSVVHYKRRLQKLVEDAGWHCRRDQMWNSMLECTTKRVETVSSSGARKFFTESSNSDMATVLRAALSTSLSVGELDKLLGYVRSMSMFDVEPMLEPLTRDFCADPFFRFLCLHFGDRRCGLFCSPVKKHLVITTNSAQQVAFLLTAYGKERLEMRIIFKDEDVANVDAESGGMDSAVRAQFDEFVRCAASFSWLEMLRSAPCGKRAA